MQDVREAVNTGRADLDPSFRTSLDPKRVSPINWWMPREDGCQDKVATYRPLVVITDIIPHRRPLIKCETP